MTRIYLIKKKKHIHKYLKLNLVKNTVHLAYWYDNYTKYKSKQHKNLILLENLLFPLNYIIDV